ncbi:MAG: peptidoglycan DD-metalloendopeptidase family protein [Bacteroidetes bacterium]|nr:peptidoglycan DD-metalloendopeptidase family protein [Bacteroidota bacterium]
MSFSLFLFYGLVDFDFRTDKSNQLEIYKQELAKIEKDILDTKSAITLNSEQLKNYTFQVSAVADLLKKVQPDTLKEERALILMDEQLKKVNDKLLKIKAKFGARVIWLYKNGENYESELLFSSKSLNDFYVRLAYLEKATKIRKSEIEKIRKEQKVLQEAKRIMTLSYAQKMKVIEGKSEDKQSLMEKKIQFENKVKSLKYRVDELERRKDFVAKNIRLIENQLADKSFDRYVTLDQNVTYDGQPVSSLKGKLIVPVLSTYILKDFGLGFDFNHRIYTYNTGIDVSIAKGSEVKAIASGTVESIVFIPMYGNMIFINHGEGIKSVYGVIENMKVKPGDVIKAGNVIAYTSDNENGQSFHFELWRWSRALDPKQWVKVN